jgi:hypothetical protein
MKNDKYFWQLRIATAVSCLQLGLLPRSPARRNLVNQLQVLLNCFRLARVAQLGPRVVLGPASGRGVMSATTRPLLPLFSLILSPGYKPQSTRRGLLAFANCNLLEQSVHVQLLLVAEGR